MREMVFAFWNTLLPQFELCAFGHGSMKCENRLSWHGFLDPILKGLFQCCFWAQVAPFQNKKTWLHCVQASPITYVSHCCTCSSQYSFFPPTLWRDSVALCFSHQPHGWWLHVSLCPHAALLGPSSLACRIRRAETIVKHGQGDSSRISY